MTEYAEVFANPDGTLTRRESFEPQRVRRNGAWIPVDLTLAARPDGTVGPKAASVDVRLSDGGPAGDVLATAVKDGSEIGLGWADSLPQPHLDGPVATYPEVLPGVDLTVTATRKGFSELLVVKTAEAAKNPRLTEISFSNHTRGVVAKEGIDGGIEAVDTNGRVVFRGDASKMWDSAGMPAGQAATSDALRSRAEAPSDQQPAVGTMDLEVTGSATIVRPDQQFLAHPDRVFPVVIDPEYWWAGGKQSHTVVQEPWPNDHNFNRTDGDLGDLKAGYQGGYRSRSYFNVDVSAIRGKVIHQASVLTRVVHSYSCSGGPTQLWLAGLLDWGTTWNNQPPRGPFLGDITRSNNAKYCPSDGAAGVRVDGTIRDAAAGGWTVMTFGLMAANEGQQNDWRRFALNPVLEVVYNSIPGVPGELGIEGGLIPCAAGDARPFVFTPTPRLRGRIADPDGGMLTARYTLQKGPLGASKEIWAGAIGNVPSGSFAEVTVPPGLITEEGVYNWSMFADDGGNSSNWVGNCEFGVDKTAPGVPVVSSTDYPGGGVIPAGGIGQTGAFTVSANGTTDVQYFQWSVTDQQNDDPKTRVNPDRLGGTGVFRWTPTTAGPLTVFVRSVDRAGNPSSIVKYSVLVREGDPLTGNLAAHWKLDGDLADTSGNGRTLIAAGGAQTTAEGYLGAATALDGTATRLYRPGAALDTTKSFSVSAWAKLDRVGGFPVAVSQDGRRTSGFQLQASPEGKWAMAMFSSDVDGGGSQHARVLSTEPVQTGVWTHLIGVYDLGAGALRLYVNGALVTEMPYTSTWNATGDVQIGAGLWTALRGDFFPGSVDDVRLYQRVLVRSEAAALANQPVLRAHYPLTEGTGTATTDAVTGQRAQLRGTAGWTETEGYTAAKFTGGYGSSYGAITGPRPTLRTDRSYTVSAWMRIDEIGEVPRTAVSLRDARFSPFMLQYRPEAKKWSFLVSVGANQEGGWWIPAEELAVAQQWVHVTGVYDHDLRRPARWSDRLERHR
jgi:hypothetical protein